MNCIVHYEQYNNETKLLVANEKSFDKLAGAKRKREEVRGQNHHEDQCKLLPDIFKKDLQYHMKCYKKFSNVYHLERKIEEIASPPRKSVRLTGNTASEVDKKQEEKTETERRGIFPDCCMICKKKVIKISGKKQYPQLILTLTAENSIKKAAELRNDLEMLSIVKEEKLIAKEFKRHENCHKEYTRIISKEPKNDSIYEKGNFDAVSERIDHDVIDNRRCISMEALLQIYGIGMEYKSRYIQLLKGRIVKFYGDRLLFLKSDYHSFEIVVSRDCLTSTPGLEVFPQEYYVEKAARLLRKACLDAISTATEISWPPTVTSLKERDEQTPVLLKLFFSTILTSRTDKSVEVVERLISSFCADILFSISRGKFLTSKHTAIGLGLHSLTGMKKPVQLLNRLGHSISYEQLLRIETAQAEVVQDLQDLSRDLPFRPESNDCKVLTTFWWDNFDRNVETSAGGGSIHITPGIAYQEVREGAVRIISKQNVEKSNRRSLLLQEEENIVAQCINPKTNPGLFYGPVTQTNSSDQDNARFSSILSLWRLLRMYAGDNELKARFEGWFCSFYKQEGFHKTVMTYLAPIPKSITEYPTITQIFERSRELRLASNMRYCHITLDIGAAIKAFQVLWNNPQAWSDIIIHLGDFHAMMAFFGAIGSFLKGSGFEEIAFQVGLCSPGSINGVISGKHYNRCWYIHEIFSESICRLFLEAFVSRNGVGFRALFNHRLQSCEDLDSILNSERFKDYKAKCEKYMQEVLEGRHGKTAQYWMQYVNLVNLLIAFHYSVKTNNYNLRLSIWDQWLPFCFATNRVHYARYGSYYVNFLKHIDETHPGAQDEMKDAGISVRQNTLGIGQAIDLAGEQTYMKSAKTTGGIIKFASRNESIYKWVFNRPYLSEFKESLESLCGKTKSSQDCLKSVRPSQIKRSNEVVSATVEAIKTQFLNPFEAELDHSKLYNLVSGCPVSEEIAQSLLNLQDSGKEMKLEFESRMTLTGESNSDFFSKIPKNKFKSFEDASKKLIVKKNGNQREISCQRDILGILISLSYKCQRPIDIEQAMTYPLAPIPLALCTYDGALRKTVKSKLFQAAMADVEEIAPADLPSTLDTYLLDVIAAIRSSSSSNCTIREFSWKLLKAIPSQYNKIVLVCDTYKENSIKGGERVKRGQGKRYTINSPDMKVPHDFGDFLKNSDNKAMLLNLMERAFIEGKERLGSRTVYFSNEKHCTLITTTQVTEVAELASDHEEADTKLVAMSFSPVISSEHLMVRSPSGDIDILVLFLLNRCSRIFIDNGSGNNRKIFDMSSLGLGDVEREALVGLHSFSGNDYVSSFFKKGKQIMWKKVKGNERYLQLFAEFGNEESLSQDSFGEIEKFVCDVYGYAKMGSVDLVRKEMFLKKCQKIGKNIDLTSLPPCKANLEYHSRRAHYVARIFRSAFKVMMDLPQSNTQGWDDYGNPLWTDTYIPNDLNELLCESEDIESELDDEYSDTSSSESESEGDDY